MKTQTNSTILSIYLTNLGKYNEGELIGEWLTLPATDDEIAETLERIGINEQYEEYFISDYESDYDIELGEYDNIDELNELAEQIAELDDNELDIFAALMSSERYDPTNALDMIDDVIVYPDCNDMTDVAYEIVAEYDYLNEIPEHLQHYFDYEAFGRDLAIENNYIFYNGHAYEVFQ